MLAHLSNENLKFLARLSKTPDGQALAAILESKLAVQDVNCRKLVGPELHQAQGRAQQLSELLDDISQAQYRLDTNASPQRPHSMDSHRSAVETRSRA